MHDLKDEVIREGQVLQWEPLVSYPAKVEKAEKAEKAKKHDSKHVLLQYFSRKFSFHRNLEKVSSLLTSNFTQLFGQTNFISFHHAQYTRAPSVSSA